MPACPRTRAQVMSGQLYAPGVPQIAEQAEMQKLVDTYGKTWHTWQVPPTWRMFLPCIPGSKLGPSGPCSSPQPGPRQTSQVGPAFQLPCTGKPDLACLPH